MTIKIKVSKTTDEEQTSAEIVASIDDLMTEILLRLPTKSVMCFKLVSKHWDSLITNPRFSILRNPNPNQAVGLFLPYCGEYAYVPFSVNKSANPPFRKLNFIKNHSDIIIMRSCNGLFLCRSIFHNGKYRRYNYHVYNPTTGQFSTIPELPCGWKMYWMSFAFDPNKSTHYKVVCVQRLEERMSQYQLEVYSSETSTWRKWDKPFTAHVDFIHGVYWNGAIHWINHRNGDSLYFNLDHQMPRIMPMPSIPDDLDRTCFCYFGESGDHLHTIGFFEPQFQFKVYEMKRDYSDWFVKYKVDLSPVVAIYPEIIPDFDPDDWFSYAFWIPTIVRCVKEDEAFLVLRIPDKVVQYNLVYGTLETICTLECDPFEPSLRKSSRMSIDAFQYIEYLCCF